MDRKKLAIILTCVAVGIVVLGIVIALLLSPITNFLNRGTGDEFRNIGSCSGETIPEAEATPGGVFITPEPNTSVQPVATPAAPDATVKPIVTPEPTVDPYQALYEKADTSMMKDIVNILLVGVDYATERETWSGKKEWHSDVMMVLAVNFAENRADLISLPRDTYAEIPGVKGIYKLNAALNCGGGLYNDDGSFNPKGMQKVLDAAEWMLGGIDINYYYAVTMTSLKDLVDLCGGLEYDMDIAFTIQGRSYQKGLQHVNGQGFLDYCRVRKGVNGLPASEQGDANRVNRQKRMLVALFRQMQADQLITKIPDLLETFDGDLFTNCTTGQTAALAAFAYNLNPENIGMYSMSGTTTSLFQWHFLFTDQSNRVNVINEVYDVKVKQYAQYTLKYGRYRWCDLLYTHYQELLDPLTKYVQKLIDEDDKLPEFTTAPTATATPAATTPPATATSTTDTPKPTAQPTEAPTDAPTEAPTEKPTEAPTEKPTEAPTDAPTGEEGDDSNAVMNRSYEEVANATATPEQTRKYTKEQRELFEKYKAAVEELDKLHTEADKEAKKAKSGKSNSLNDISQKYIKKLDEVQDLAIAVAKEFNYTKVKNITMQFGPTGTGWNSSPWAFNYGRMKSFNEVIVDFN